MKPEHYQYSDQAPPQPQYGYGQPQYGQPVDVYGQPAPSFAPDVTPLKPEAPPAAACRDLPWAVLFLVNVAVVLALVALYGKDAIADDASTKTSTSSSSDRFLSSKDTRNTLVLAGVLAVVALVLAQASVSLIVRYARCMIYTSLWFSFASSVAMVVLAFSIHNYVLGAIGIIVALFTLCYVYAVRSRIPFAVANLHVAAAAVSKHWSTYLVSLLLTLVQIAWVILWSLAFLGVFNKLRSNTDVSGLADGETCRVSSDCQSKSCVYSASYGRYCASSSSRFYKNSGGSYAAYFFLLVSFYWGLQVFKNISHTTVAGTVATFWYNAESAGATGASLKRATTTSLGSICFGSLLVAVIQALRQLAQQAQDEGDWLACIAQCILSCLQSIIEYINRWAYIYVGIYGYKFTQAGRAVFDLFHQRGFDAIINDDLIGNMLNLVAFGVGIICALIGVAVAQWGNFVSFDNSSVVLGLLGLFIGVGVAITPLSVVDSAVATIFVCFAEDPAAFQRSHPDLYQPLVTEWHNLYPEMIAAAGYWTPVMC